MEVLLVCNAGMSTGILQMKLEDEAKKRDKQMNILAVPMSELDEHLERVDAILLGPQIRFAQDDIKKLVSDKIPVIVISAQDFGLMNANKVMDILFEELKIN